ncbi:MAG: hypothetical protein MJE77_40740 [Proteobacteria bacterium]|nr:hypothetical protein [Pseudomonadota bacterium]
MSSLLHAIDRLLFGPFSDSPAERVWTFCVRLCFLCNVWLAWQVFQLCLTKAYALDEFHYVHAAWTAQTSGQSLLEMFTRGTQFVTSLLIMPFVLLGGDNPAHMIFVRLEMFPFFVTAAIAGAYLAGHSALPRRMLAAQVAVLLAFATQVHVWHGIEIRPDIIGTMLTLLSVALVYQGRWRPRPSAFAAGFVLFLACFASTKVFVYGAAFAPIVLIDVYGACRGREQMLRSAFFFAAGFATGLIGLIALLAATGSFASFWAGFYQHPVAHEKFYPEIPLEHTLQPFFLATVPMWIAGALGLFAVIRRAVLQVVRERIYHRDWLLVVLFFSTWMSYIIQKAPYPYSMIPGIALLAVFAARGVHVVASAISLDERSSRTTVCVGAVVAVVAIAWATGYRLEPRFTNQDQIAAQQTIDQLTQVTDTAYDLSGTFVYRPRAHRFIFVDNARRIQFGKTLPDEVARALIENETTLFVYEVRFHTYWRKGPLGRFILHHYQPYSGDLYLWGRRWPVEHGVDDTFLAVKESRYFIHPPHAVRDGELRIDGERISEPIIELGKGEHKVTFEPGRARYRAIYLIWLPRDGRVFDPTKPRKPFSLGARVLP